MRITVITVCLNAVQTIEETIRSVLEQDWPDVEYIIVDGASTDGTMDIIAAYRQRLSLVISEPDRGLYDAMNKGVLHSTGKVLNFMNADDHFIAPDVLRRVAEAFEQHPQAMVIYGDCVVDEGDTQVLKRHPDSISRHLLGMIFMNQQSMFYRKAALDIVGSFDHGYRVYGDYDWNVRAFVARQLPHVHLPMPVCVFRRGGISGLPAYDRRSELKDIHRRRLSFWQRLRCWPVTFFAKVFRRLAMMVRRGIPSMPTYQSINAAPPHDHQS